MSKGENMNVAFYGIMIGFGLILLVHSFLLLSVSQKQEKMNRQLKKLTGRRKKRRKRH